MRVLPVINTNYLSYKSNLQASSQPSFRCLPCNGMGTTPAKHLLDVSMRTNIKTTSAALKELRGKFEGGALLKTADGFASVSYENFCKLMTEAPESIQNVPEIIFKRPRQTFWTGDKTQYQARLGFLTGNLVNFLKTSATKITAIVDNDYTQEISITSDLSKRQKALKYFEQRPELADGENFLLNDMRTNLGYTFEALKSIIIKSNLEGFETRTGHLAGI